VLTSRVLSDSTELTLAFARSASTTACSLAAGMLTECRRSGTTSELSVAPASAIAAAWSEADVPGAKVTR
jgi:hypothetical protein